MSNQHADKLMAMADFTRRLKALATITNGSRPHWEADRQAEIDALEAGAMALVTRPAYLVEDNPKLYDIARQVCHEQGIPWTDPRTGITHHPEKPE
jgi:uncharacterized protein YabN with tetrapyrrole methylase and pyrophosphatase domain